MGAVGAHALGGVRLSRLGGRLLLHGRPLDLVIHVRIKILELIQHVGIRLPHPTVVRLFRVSSLFGVSCLGFIWSFGLVIGVWFGFGGWGLGLGIWV